MSIYVSIKRVLSLNQLAATFATKALTLSRVFYGISVAMNRIKATSAESAPNLSQWVKILSTI